VFYTSVPVKVDHTLREDDMVTLHTTMHQSRHMLLPWYCDCDLLTAKEQVDRAGLDARHDVCQTLVGTAFFTVLGELQRNVNSKFGTRAHHLAPYDPGLTPAFDRRQVNVILNLSNRCIRSSAMRGIIPRGYH
jgi:hypothetical protein